MSDSQNSKIDFSQYRTPELAKSIYEIVSLPNALGSLIRTGLFGLISLVIGVYCLLQFSGVWGSTSSWILLSYSIIAGAVGGTVYGVASLIQRSMQNIFRIVDILIETTARVAADYRRIAQGKTRIPSNRELIQDVYHQVIETILKESIFSSFGVLGRPIHWFYYRTMDRVIKWIISGSRFKNTDTTPISMEPLQPISEHEAKIVSSLQAIRSKLDGIGVRVKILLLIPTYLTLASIVALILLPIGIVWQLMISGFAIMPAPLFL